MTTVHTGTRSASSKGVPFKRLKTAVAGYELRDFAASHFGDGLLSVEPRNATMTDLTVGPGSIFDFYRVLYMPYSDTVLDGFVVREVVANDLERGFSSLKVARNGLFEDVTAVSRAAGSTDLPGGFVTSDAAASNIVYRRCDAQGFHQVVQPGAYVNGDGFADERSCTGMVYEDCVSTDNGDGGLDTKSTDVTVNGFVAARNGRNGRFWASGTVTDFTSVDPEKCHLWFGGGDQLGSYTLIRPEFIGGSDKPHLQIDAGNSAAQITIVDPQLPDGEQLRVVQNDTGRLVHVQVIHTVEPAAAPLRTLPVSVTVDGVTYAGDLTEQASS